MAIKSSLYRFTQVRLLAICGPSVTSLKIICRNHQLRHRPQPTRPLPLARRMLGLFRLTCLAADALDGQQSKLFHSADTGALTSLYAGCAAEAAELNGQVGRSFPQPASRRSSLANVRMRVLGSLGAELRSAGRSSRSSAWGEALGVARGEDRSSRMTWAIIAVFGRGM